MGISQWLETRYYILWGYTGCIRLGKQQLRSYSFVAGVILWFWRECCADSLEMDFVIRPCTEPASGEICEVVCGTNARTEIWSTCTASIRPITSWQQCPSNSYKCDRFVPQFFWRLQLTITHQVLLSLKYFPGKYILLWDTSTIVNWLETLRGISSQWPLEAYPSQ